MRTHTLVCKPICLAAAYSMYSCTCLDDALQDMLDEIAMRAAWAEQCLRENGRLLNTQACRASAASETCHCTQQTLI